VREGRTGQVRRHRLWIGQGRPGGRGTTGAPSLERHALSRNRRLGHTRRRRRPSTAEWREMAATGVLLQEAVGGRHQVLHLRQKAAGRFLRDQTFQVLTGGATVPPTDRPQATRHIPVPHHAAVVGPPAATALLHRRIHIGHQTHTRPGKCGSGRLEPPTSSNRAAAATEPTALSHSRCRGLARRGAGSSGTAQCAADQLFGDGRCAAGLPGGATDDELDHAADHNPGGWRRDAARDASTGVFRPLVPIQHREAVFQSLHAIHHPGVRATRRLIAARFCWPQMAKAITQMARACLHCQRGKVHRHVHLQPAEIPVPHRRFAHIHVDLVGPLPPSRGHTYLFTIIDQTSRWPEAIPLTSITAADCARALFAGWVSRFGVPATITSDRGAQSHPP
jgi:hypothetical protein